jgi:S-adenosylmethionine:tRNA ribosyltransferase-isomerase
LLVLDRATGNLAHCGVRDLPDLLRAGDCLVLNDTRVVPARLFGVRAATGGKWEGLFLRGETGGDWQLIGHAGGKLHAGETISVFPAHGDGSAERLELRLQECDEEGVWTARPSRDEAPFELLARFGTVPLPPYIRRKLATSSDWERYQTAYAARPGAVAAPTAGLHFTPELLAACADRGIRRTFVTLHVGIGTFRPIAVDRLSAHSMHSEWCEVSAETCRELERTRAAGGRVVAVGTTAVRALETSFSEGAYRTWSGETSLFIRPPRVFGGVDALVTNFHLPRSTLFVLVSAFAGLETIRRAYAEAVRRRYRFYSYGDAMLIL